MRAWFRLAALTMGLLLHLPQLGAAEPPRYDQYGDLLPPDALARIGSQRLRHYAAIYSLAYSADGKLIAGGDSFERGSESSIVVWDATGRQLHRLEGYGHVVRGLAFAPDGRMLAAVCGDGSLRIWVVNTEKVIATIKPLRSFSAAAFLQDGTVVAADGQGIGLWDASTGRPLGRLEGLQGALFRVAMSPNDKQIASCDQNGLILLWDRETRKVLGRFQIQSRYGGYPAFSPDGKRLACGGEDALYLWDLATGKELLRIRTPDWFLSSQPFLSDGKVLVSYKEHAVRFWDTAKGEEIRRIEGHRGRVAALALSPDGKIVVTGDSNEASIRLWDAATGKPKPRPVGHELPVTSVSFAPDGKKVATASNELMFRLWDAASGRVVRTFNHSEDNCIRSVAFSPDGASLASARFEIAGSGQPVSLWEIKTGRRLRGFGKEGEGSKQVAFSDDGTTLAASLHYNHVVLWDVARGKPQPHPFIGNLNVTISSMPYAPFVLSPDGKTLAVANPDLLMWDTVNGKQRFAVADRRGRATANPPEIPADFSPDGRRLVTLEDQTVRVRETLSGRVVRTLRGHTDSVFCAAFSRDGRLLASAGRDRTVRLWDLATGKEQRIFRGHEGWIWCVAFAPGGQRIVSGSSDMTALIWSLKETRQVQATRPHLSAKELESRWGKLAGADAEAAEQAIWDFVLAGNAGVAFLKERLGPVLPVSAERFATLFANLDSKSFEVRDKAQTDLIHLGEAAIPLLRKARDQGQPTLERRRRIEQILAQIDESEVSRELRAIDVLEHSDSASARPMLERLAGGVAESRQTSAAKAALKRLDRRSARK
jgi:WD40 repeat protein